jgi:hypothetical protein
MIDNLSFRILQHCCDDFLPIKSLIDKSTSRSTFYRCKGKLCTNGWLEADGKGRYRTTERGIQRLQSLLGEVPEGLATIYPPLTQVPTSYHRAAIELSVAAVIARSHDLRPDRHPSIILAGPTLKWKTSAAIFTCHMIGLDPSTHIVNLAAEAGRSLWLRKTSTGEIHYKRDLLEAPLVVFDELQNADPECKRFLKIWMDGRKVFLLENEKLTLQATSFITLNPCEGHSLEERVGLDRAQIRRCLIGDLTNIKILDLAIKGEEAIKAAKTHAPLMTPKPRHDCTPYKTQTYDLLSRTLNDAGMELVDLETLVMLSTAMTAFMEPVEAIRSVLYDSHLLYQTLGWTIPDWQLHVTNFPKTVHRDTTPEILPSNRRIASDRRLIKAFRHLDSGGSATELISKLNLTLEDAEKIARKHAELKNLDSKTHAQTAAEIKDPEIQRLEHEVNLAELMRKKRELLGPLEADKALTDLKTTLDVSGDWKQRHCTHMLNNYCLNWQWEHKPDSPYQVSEPILKDGRWYIRPTYVRCATCPTFQELDTATLQSIGHRLSTVEALLKRTDNAIRTLNTTFDVLGSIKRQQCIHLQDDYCMFRYWIQRPKHISMLGPPLLKDSKWYIRPTNTYCALCPDYCTNG